MATGAEVWPHQETTPLLSVEKHVERKREEWKDRDPLPHNSVFFHAASRHRPIIAPDQQPDSVSAVAVKPRRLLRWSIGVSLSRSCLQMITVRRV